MTYITGDTHCPFDVEKLNPDRFPEQQTLHKSDYLIICGDAGIIWSETTDRDRKWINWFNNMPYTTLFIDGNHENHNKLNNFNVERWNGGLIHRISDSILHLMRGQVFTIDGNRIFTMGGAKTFYGEYCVEGQGWWCAEMPSDYEMEAGLKNLCSCRWNVDYVITHSAPNRIVDRINPEFLHNKLNQYLEFISQHLTFKHWYFGHYHLDDVIEEKYTCLFNHIIQLPNAASALQ